MLPAVFAFAYPGECARLMVAHPGIESLAPVAAIVSLAAMWGLVRLLSRSSFSATAAVLILLFMPAFRLGIVHPFVRNFVLAAVLLVLVAGVGAFRWFFRKDEERNADGQVMLRHVVFLGLSVFVTASLSALDFMNVYVSALAAFIGGISLSHWWRHSGSSLLAKLSFWLLAFVFSFSFVFELATAQWTAGAFADRMSEAIIDDMGDRDWIVTDGSLDDHIRLVAKAKGRSVNIVSLARDNDTSYRRELAALVRERRLCGDDSEELALSLDLGVYQFLQDWFRLDPEIAKKCVVFGAPDLWYSVGIDPVPEVLFFGADSGRKVDWSRWQELKPMLHEVNGWGSYRSWNERDPVALLRHSLRRHLGHVANDRGVWLQDGGRDEEAFAMYRLVVEEIDRDNVSSMFNILAMADAKYAPAVTAAKDVEERMKRIVEDKNRRYVLGALSRFYGYIRNPDMFVRLGYQWARSGVPGSAISQIRRAIDLVPSDRRTTLVNMLASLYVEASDVEKSRKAFRQILEADSSNHEALIGMMRLSLLDGDQKRALEYLERAVAAGGDNPAIEIERALVSVMKNDLDSAAAALRRYADSHTSDQRALSLLAAVTLQRYDSEKDPGKKSAFGKELEGEILPALEARSAGGDDFFASTVRGFIMLRKGADHRREARDAFVRAAQAHPGDSATYDMLLGLDIGLNDPVSAEAHARELLKYNRKAALANYIMGSVALARNDLKSAELYLKRAADAEKPVDLALNDLAEVYRRLSRSEDGLAYAEKAVAVSPRLYVAKATLAAVLMDLGREPSRALELMNEAVSLAKENGRIADFRMYVGLARAQFVNGDVKGARTTLRKMKSREAELSGFEKREYEELLKNVR